MATATPEATCRPRYTMDVAPVPSSCSSSYVDGSVPTRRDDRGGVAGERGGQRERDRAREEVEVEVAVDPESLDLAEVGVGRWKGTMAPSDEGGGAAKANPGGDGPPGREGAAGPGGRGKMKSEESRVGMRVMMVEHEGAWKVR